MSKQPNTYAKGPWNFKRTELDKFAKVTPANRAHAVKYGRIFYVIDGTLFRGAFTVDPCFSKGQWMYPWKPWESGTGHFKVFMPEDMNFEEYKASYKAMIDKMIDEGSLYVNPSDPVLTYYRV